jgi:hypothetical protein
MSACVAAWCMHAAQTATECWSAERSAAAAAECTGLAAVDCAAQLVAAAAGCPSWDDTKQGMLLLQQHLLACMQLLLCSLWAQAAGTRQAAAATAAHAPAAAAGEDASATQQRLPTCRMLRCSPILQPSATFNVCSTCRHTGMDTPTGTRGHTTVEPATGTLLLLLGGLATQSLGITLTAASRNAGCMRDQACMHSMLLLLQRVGFGRQKHTPPCCGPQQAVSHVPPLLLRQ